MNRCFGNRLRLAGEDGWTLIEMLLVLIMTSILAALFSETLISSIEIYTDHNMRKTEHFDARRALDVFLHDLHEWDSYSAAVAADKVPYMRNMRFKRQILFWTRYYYEPVTHLYRYNGVDLIYRRDADGDWSNVYLLIKGTPSAGTQITLNTLGGTDRLRLNINLSIGGKPMRFQTTVFPRKQGG